MNQKQILRQEARALLSSFSPEKIRDDSVRACQLLRDQSIWRNAKSVLLYAPLQRELDIWDLFREATRSRKIVALPRFDAATGTYVAAEAAENALISGAFGALEPPSGAPIIKPLDFILVPGLGFDSQGRRLGRGRGFYDRILSEAPVGSVKCGIAFDEQILSEIPAEAHDVSVDFIVTPSRWLICRGQAPAR
jgi:5-formyltetrahydrofolate cyclo-ligase